MYSTTAGKMCAHCSRLGGDRPASRATLRSSLQLSFVLAAALLLAPGTTSAQSGIIDDDLLLQGPNPTVVFDDNSGALQQWAIHGDHIGFTIYDRTSFVSSVHILPGNGFVGLNTSIPMQPLHLINRHTTPVIRLERQLPDASFYNWEVGGNTGKFFIRGGGENDASLLKSPLVVEASAPEPSIWVKKNGNVGIRTNNATDRLHVDVGSASAGLLISKNSTSGSSVPQWSIYNASAKSGSGQLWRCRVNSNGNLSFLNATNVKTPLVVTPDALNNALVINAGGISVNGNQMNVPDYVFEPDYKLRSLAELKKFIETHKHLPGIPNAKQINEQGVSLPHFPLNLLEKIEELTLYTLQQEQTISDLQNKVRENETTIAKLQTTAREDQETMSELKSIVLELRSRLDDVEQRLQAGTTPR